MRTALILLFALAVAADPGSLVPQRPASPIAVRDFVAEHPQLGPIYDAVGLFDVYNSVWFSAIYLLLFVSSSAASSPGSASTRRHCARRRRAPRATCPDCPPTPPGQWTSAETVRARAGGGELRRQRYRVRIADGSVSAERGYLREAGNLVFHVSLLFLLLGVALGGLFGFRGTSVVVVGQGFANTITQYDDFTSGGRFSDSQLKPFAVSVRDFRVRFELGDVQRGAARLFALDAEVTPRPGAAPMRQTIEVNRPLVVDGTTVHLIGHGYAPLVTVTDGQGDVAFSGPVIFLPQDGNFTSAGVIKAPDGRPERLAFEGIFAPDRRRRRSRAEVAVPGRAGPGPLRQRLGRSAEGGDG